MERKAEKLQGPHTYYDNKAQVGSLNKMDTLTDQTLLCWADCHYIQAVVHVSRVHGYNGQPEHVRGLYSARRVGSSWTPEGKRKWSELKTDLKAAWETSDIIVVGTCVSTKQVSAVKAFKRQFKQRWMALHGSGISGTGGSRAVRNTQAEQGNGVEMDLLRTFVDPSRYQDGTIM